MPLAPRARALRLQKPKVLRADPRVECRHRRRGSPLERSPNRETEVPNRCDKGVPQRAEDAIADVRVQLRAQGAAGAR